jgi:hypothetical protein
LVQGNIAQVITSIFNPADPTNAAVSASTLTQDGKKDSRKIQFLILFWWFKK